MKLLFLSLIVIVNGVCFGQKKDSVAIISKWTSATYVTPANGIGMTISGVQTSTEPKQDTVACLMLVCDTLKRSNGVLWLDSTGKVMDEVLSTTPEVWWKPGFMVKSEKLIKDKWSGCDGCTYEYTAIITSYLDRRKKPLDSWIVVWMTKEVK